MLGEKMDDEMREMVKMEIEELTQREQELAENSDSAAAEGPERR